MTLTQIILSLKKLEQYLNYVFPFALGLGAYSTSNRNEYQKN
jgi:hypothetical protein